MLFYSCLATGVRKFHDVLSTVSRLYKTVTRSYTGKLCLLLKDGLMSLKTEVLHVLRTVSVYLEQFHFVREVVQSYYDYQSWLEEVHFSQHLEEALGEVKE